MPICHNLLSGFLQICLTFAQWGMLYTKLSLPIHRGGKDSDGTALGDGPSSLLCIHPPAAAWWHVGRVSSPETPGTEQLQT